MDASSTPGSAEPNPRYGLDRSLGYLLNRTADIVSSAFVEILRNESISLAEWRVLTALTDRDHQTLSELASHAGAELSYLSRVVLQIEARGLVARSASPDDKRATRASITGDGRAMVQAVMPLAKALEASWLTGIPAEDVRVLRKTLQALYLNVLNSAPVAQSSGRKLTVARRARARREEPPATKKARPR